MILAKADMTIARLYADLVERPGARGRGSSAGSRPSTTARSRWSARSPASRHCWNGRRCCSTSIQQRNPYVDPLSFIQLVLLQRLRAGEGPREELVTGVLESINGIASGLKNTG